VLQILLLSLCCAVLTYASAAHAAVFTCKSPSGEKTFTDDARKCGGKTAEQLALNTPKDTRVNYRYPARSYEKINSAWRIFIEQPEQKNDHLIYKKAIARLEKTLTLINKKFPVHTRAKLQTVTFYIMRGPKSSLGGENSILRYAHNGSTKDYSLHDQRWNNAVIIYNVDDYLWQNDLWNTKTIMHELAHAWHFLRWGYEHQTITNAWLNSRNSGLYQAVKTREGRILKPAYASTNTMEYFAELSVLYFAEGDYFPFNKKGLQAYDPAGYAMIEKHWHETNPVSAALKERL
jgi:hypothetical protein